MSPGVGWLLAALLSSAADYRSDSTAWNGASRLAGLGAEQGCRVVSPTVLEWDRLDGGDILWILYPRRGIEPEKLLGFLRAGGRAVVADDFGRAADALARVGIRRSEGSPPGQAMIDHNPALRIAAAARPSALGGRGAALITNHPAYFSSTIPASFEFDPGAGAVVDALVDAGHLIVISDPSIFINNMLDFDENRIFATNLIRSLCRPGRDRIVLLAGEFEDRGAPPEWLDGTPAGAAPLRAELTRIARQIGDETASAISSRLGAVAMVLLAAFLFFRSLAGRLPSLDGRWTRRRSPGSGYAGMVSGYAAGRLDWGDRQLLLHLRDETSRRLTPLLGGPPDSLPPSKIAEILAVRLGDSDGREAAQLWRLVRRRPGQLALGLGRRLRRGHLLARRLFARLPAALTET